MPGLAEGPEGIRTAPRHLEIAVTEGPEGVCSTVHTLIPPARAMPNTKIRSAKGTNFKEDGSTFPLKDELCLILVSRD